MKKRRREILDLAHRYGWRLVRMARGSHAVLEHRSGHRVVVGLNQASPRNMKNIEADLRRTRAVAPDAADRLARME